MSYPPTEADVISNDSIFSDSFEFDAAEKPASGNDAYKFAEEIQNEYTAFEDGDSMTTGLVYAEEPVVASPPVTNAFMKPRKLATKPPQRWDPVSLQVPEDDPEDEFDIGTAQKPVYENLAPSSATHGSSAAAAASTKIEFLNGEPDMQGDVTNCFEEPGILYRVVNRRNKTWAFYNDSRAFEVFVVCTFGKHSKVKPLENAKMTLNDKTGEYVVEAIVYPGETELFISGFVNGFSSKLRALPLSEEYLRSRSEAQNEKLVQAEIDAIRAIAGDETDAERVLEICLENHLPFVDLSFPPVQSSIDSGASKPFKPLPWGRPHMCVKPEMQSQVRLFRNAIYPGCVEQGELGNCWFICALTTLSEEPRAIIKMFRHPKGADAARCERAIGAYRVSFSKNGLWRSVLVDDYLPVVAGQPVYTRSSDPCELWPSILEKAFAKLHGSYAMIQSGDPMHALTDMTGFPAMRFDDMFANPAEPNPRELLLKMLQWQKQGYQAIFTTPGKAPAISTEKKSSPDFTGQPDMETALAGTGLLPGHAYTVLDVKEFIREQVRLVCVRNPWVFGDGWTHAWGWDSPLWKQHGDIATACGFHRCEGDPSTVWMTFEDAMRYFIGGGVLFCAPLAQDARVPITFTDRVPGVVFQVSVKAPIDVTFILSNMDHRGMHIDEAGAADFDPNNMDYPPVMLSLAEPLKESDVYRVVQNTSIEMTQPSDASWLFLQAREISMTCHLEPKASPYLLIPRLMEHEAAAVDKEKNENMRDMVHPIYYRNDHAHLFPGAADASGKEIAVTIGFETEEILGANVMVRLCRMSESNPVLDNFPKFPADDVVPHEKNLYFQTKAVHCGYAQEKSGTALH